MRSPLNSPLEVGVRVLMILVGAYPNRLDVNRLLLLDHGVLHSADLDGPSSLHPALPVRAGELGVKRKVIEEGLQVMVRAKLIDMSTSGQGIDFVASEDAYSFVSALDSDYVKVLRERVTWIFNHFSDLSEEVLRTQMRSIFSSWSEEFGQTDAINNGIL